MVMTYCFSLCDITLSRRLKTVIVCGTRAALLVMRRKRGRRSVTFTNCLTNDCDHAIGYKLSVVFLPSN